MPRFSTSRRMRTIRNGPKSKLCRTCWRRNVEPQLRNVAFRLAGGGRGCVFVPAWACCRRRTPRRLSRRLPRLLKRHEATRIPFAPQPAPPLPPGMTGSDTSDPRYTLKPGIVRRGRSGDGHEARGVLEEAGCVSAYATIRDDPKVQKMLGKLGIERHLEDARSRCRW